MTGAEVVVASLKAAGVEVAFGVISIHNLPIFDAAAREGLRIVPARSESGAVNMADGYARASGRLGVAVTSTGTGAGNAAGALLEAQTAGSPVLHLTGQIDSAFLDKGRGYIHEVRDQLTMLRGASKAAHRATQAGNLSGLMRQAMADALTAPAGPVSVESPIDIQAGDALCPPLASPPPIERTAPAACEVAAAAGLLNEARRPIIWAGGGVTASDAGVELTAVAELLGAPVLLSQAGRGTMPEDHPLCLGNWGQNRLLWPFIESCDVLLIVGSHLRANETATWQMPVPKRIVQLDVDPRAIGRGYRADVGVVGDAKVALNQLLVALGPPGDGSLGAAAKTWPGSSIEAARGATEQARRATVASVGPFAPLMNTMRTLLPRDGLLVRDVTVIGSVWANRVFPIYQPRTSMVARGGGIGQGLQMAIGAQIACPDKKVLCLCGDGGFILNVGELGTAVQERLPIVVVLFNDGGYGVIRNIQEREFGARYVGVDLEQPDFQLLGRAFGLRTARVSSDEAFAASLREALDGHKPSLIEVDMPAMGRISYGGPPR